MIYTFSKSNNYIVSFHQSFILIDMRQVFLHGPKGRIEGIISNEDKEDTKSVAVLFHSHPDVGGSFEEENIQNLFNTLVKKNFITLAINFRGIGRSEGVFDNGIGELEDASACLDWVCANNLPCKNIWVCGFSFGSWITMQIAMRRPEVKNFVAISPLIKKYDFSFFHPCNMRGIVLQGNLDSVSDVNDVSKFFSPIVEKKNKRIIYKIIHRGDHFMRNKEKELSEIIEDYIEVEKNVPDDVSLADKRTRQKY